MTPGPENYRWGGRHVHVDVSPLYHRTMCCHLCKLYWHGQPASHCPECGMPADDYRDSDGKVKPAPARMPC